MIVTATKHPYKGNGNYERNWLWDGPRKPRVYVWPKGESILANLVVGRHNRPTDAYRKQVLPLVWAQLGITDPPKVIWSQTAGCRCGCSPAFIAQVRDREFAFDIHVEVEDGPRTDVSALSDEALAVAVTRLESVKADPTLAPLLGVES